MAGKSQTVQIIVKTSKTRPQPQVWCSRQLTWASTSRQMSWNIKNNKTTATLKSWKYGTPSSPHYTHVGLTLVWRGHSRVGVTHVWWGTFTCGSYSRVEGTFMCGSYSRVVGTFTCGSYSCVVGTFTCGSYSRVEGAFMCWGFLTCGTSHQSEILHSLIFKSIHNLQKRTWILKINPVG